MARLEDTLSYKPAALKFGTSGLRGLVTDMTDLECYINTAGFLAFLRKSDGLKDGEVIYLAGDLRDSTPRILKAVQQAILDGGYSVEYCGLIPTPTLAFYALQKQGACIMVTGSHIPADRNGIKFYKREGEVLKEDESGIFESVANVRTELYGQEESESRFDAQGMLKKVSDLPAETTAARKMYLERHQAVFNKYTFAGKEIVFYQHSAVGRDLLVELLESLGATVTPVGRSDVFIPIDSENVKPEDQAYFHKLAEEHPNAFAIVSTDGDSDRPFVIDENGTFHRGDVLGAVVATWLKADASAYPVSSSDATDDYLQSNNIAFTHTKIGSPYVISAMEDAYNAGKQRVVGWEVNGGFMLGCDVEVNGATLEALPTRDAIFPIIVALVAAQQKNTTISRLFGELPARYTQAGLIDDFPTEVSKEIVSRYAQDTPEVHAQLSEYFTADQGFGKIYKIDALDGVRIFFDNGDIAHLRPSGNAPQLRIYGIADSQERADEIVKLAITEPDGIFRKIQASL